MRNSVWIGMVDGGFDGTDNLTGSGIAGEFEHLRSQIAATALLANRSINQSFVSTLLALLSCSRDQKGVL